jgi:uroporphyrinogen-III synthase
MVRMKSKVVAILETRTGEHLAELVARRGGIPMLAPALEEVPDVDPAAIADMLRQWKTEPFTAVIFQTGVGTRALFQATDAADTTSELLEFLKTSLIAVRGPKPVGELNARQVRIDIRAPSPFTTETLLEALRDTPLAGARVLVQRYGADNAKLREALLGRGAAVLEIATYRWGLPANIQPLIDLLDAIAASRVDCVVFTSAVQIQHLYAVALQAGRQQELTHQLNQLVIASIGPVCSRALRDRGIAPSFEANPPKLGPLMAALDAALSVPD